jgi:hypothetical protein
MKKLTCPKCASRVEIPTPAPDSVECSSCGSILKLKARTPKVDSPPAAPPAKPATIKAMVVVDADNDSPLERKRKPKKKKDSQESNDAPRTRRIPLALIIGIPLGLLGLCVFGGLMGWLVLGGKDRESSDTTSSTRSKISLTQFDPIPWAVPASPASAPSVIAIPNIVRTKGNYYLTWLQDIPRHEVPNVRIWSVGQLDPTTGQPIGSPRVIYRESVDAPNGGPSGPMMPSLPMNPGLPQMGQSPQMGQAQPKAATPAPASALRVRVFDIDSTGAVAFVMSDESLRIWSVNGTEPSAFASQGKPAPTKGIRWNANHQLLRFTDNGLAVINPSTGAEVARSNEQYQDWPWAMSPGGHWLIVLGGKMASSYFEVVDAQTARPIGRFGGQGNWLNVSVSPKGDRIVAIRPDVDSAAPRELRSDMLELYEFDVKSGQQSAFIRYHKMIGRPNAPLEADVGFQRKSLGHLVPGVSWWDDSKVWVSRAGLFDLTERAHIYAIGRQLSPDAPDSGPWQEDDSGSWKRLPKPTVPPIGKVVFRPGDRVQLEVDAGDRSSTRRVLNSLQELLAEEGYQTGGGEWKMKYKVEVVDSSLVFDVPTGGQIVTPKAVTQFELVSPDNKIVFTDRQEVNWGDVQARFQTGSESGLKRGMDAKTTITKYNFGSKSLREAIEEAVRDESAKRVARMRWPRSVATNPDGSYATLPLAVMPSSNGE